MNSFLYLNFYIFYKYLNTLKLENTGCYINFASKDSWRSNRTIIYKLNLNLKTQTLHTVLWFKFT